ncbi:MAG: bifunctional nuclease family protein [Candidatus Latescibacterota bacterium]
MEVSGVYTSAKSAYPQVVLKEKQGNSYLPIVIGRFEAAAISMAQSERKPARPISYDLARAILDLVNARVERVEITDLHEGTYYAEVYLRSEDGATSVLDSRPSDAIALALRMGAPIYAAAEVLREAGYVRPEEPADAPVARRAGSRSRPEAVGPQPPLARPAGQLEALRRRLQQAVAEEVYEEAARLRDEITRLEEQGAGG